MEIKKLSIDRALWGKGRLLYPDGKMCCLGHLGRACGVTDGEMRWQCFPDLTDVTNKWPKAFRGVENQDDFGVDVIAASINDHPKMPAKEKEERLKTLFRAHGIKMTFHGKARR